MITTCTSFLLTPLSLAVTMKSLLLSAPRTVAAAGVVASSAPLVSNMAPKTGPVPVNSAISARMPRAPVLLFTSSMIVCAVVTPLSISILIVLPSRVAMAALPVTAPPSTNSTLSDELVPIVLLRKVMSLLSPTKLNVAHGATPVTPPKVVPMLYLTPV